MSEHLFSDTRLVPVPPEEIFPLLADPARHAEIDGSGTVHGLVSEPGPMQLGSKFTIAMKRGRFSYKVTSEVVEYEENRRIAWCHVVKNRWRYELEPVEGGTLVTESADYRDARLRWIAIKMQGPENLKANIAATLDNLVERFSG